jgi:predicted RNA-binding Zn ribbon-like protein
MATGQWIEIDGTRTWFDSGALSLDLVHASVQTATDLAAWLTARFDHVADDTSDRDLADALALRAALQRLTRAQVEATQPSADDVDTVNLFAATPDIPPALGGGHRQAGRTRVRTGQALSTIARDAVQLLSQNTESRIRECDADDCHLVFYDESRTNNRRWCSMQRCGNRAKVRAFRAKEKQ